MVPLLLCSSLDILENSEFTHRGDSFAIEALSAGERIEGRMVGSVTLSFEGIKVEY